MSAFTGSSWIRVVLVDGLICDSIVGCSHFILGFAWIALSVGGNVRHEFIILGAHFTIGIELGDFLVLEDLEDDTGSDGGGSDSTATNLEESSFFWHFKNIYL